MAADLHGEKGRGWIGVDLDGTLAEYHGWVSSDHIGRPIPKMVARVMSWLAEGREVRIMTARVAPTKGDANYCREIILAWLKENLGIILPVTHEKDQFMRELWDDRVVQVIPNTGERADGKE
jgi:hypothetical protein